MTSAPPPSAEPAFASKGGRKLPRPTAPAAAEAVEQAERELDLLERQLPKSADALFAEAYPHLEAAAARLERQAHDDDERVEAAILAALAALDERAELDRQARWTEQALWESSIVPFDSRARAAANSPIATELRRTLSELAHEREQRRRRRHERRVQVAMHFHEDRSPRSSDGRSLAARRAEAERAVREAEQAGR